MSRRKVAVPKHVKVGPFDYRIIPMSSDEATERGLNGETDNEKLEVLLCTEMPAQKIAEVLLHELFHCCYDNAKLQPGDDEERVVSMFAVQMIGVMRDNPDVIEFMMKHLRK